MKRMLFGKACLVQAVWIAILAASTPKGLSFTVTSPSLKQSSSIAFNRVEILLSTSSPKQHQQNQKVENIMTLMSSADDELATVSDKMDTSDGESADASAIRVEPDTHDELMYALGVNLARQLGDVRPLVESGEELAQVAKGLLDTVVGRLADDGQRELLKRRGKELNELIANRANTIRERLEEAGRSMLKSMSENEGVEILESGVVLHVLEHGPDGPGKGTRPTKASTVKIHYHGTLADGTIFDSTLGGEPVVFPLAGVIPGWRDGVMKMRQGETAMLGIPPEQGYGPEGTPDGRIPGGSTLFFKIQLLEVMSAGIDDGPTILGADGKKITKGGANSSGLLGADGKPL